MGDLISYLKWRGDGTFAEHPYNEVDGLALALLSYTRFTNVIPPPFIDAEAIKKAKGDSTAANGIGSDPEKMMPKENEDPASSADDDTPAESEEDGQMQAGAEAPAESEGDGQMQAEIEVSAESEEDGQMPAEVEAPAESEGDGQMQTEPEWYEEFVPDDSDFLSSTDIDTDTAEEILGITIKKISDEAAADTDGLNLAAVTTADFSDYVREAEDAGDVDTADNSDEPESGSEVEAKTPEENESPSVEAVDADAAVEAADADVAVETAEIDAAVETAETDAAADAETDVPPEPVLPPAAPQTLREAAEKCLAAETGFATPFPEPCRDLLREMGKSDRFGDLMLSDYVSVEDEEENLLFSALCIDLPDGTRYISYRGTGDEIEDWRQDFMISFQETPAQKMALNYLLNEILTCDKNFRIGGHSKGANLALYASMMLPKNYRDRIIEIYNADGPGICPEFRQEEGYYQSLSVMRRIIPEFSVVGMLFEPPVPAVIVASSEKGILQHNAFTWQVEGSSFVRKKELSAESQEYNRIFNEWIEDADMEDRESFTEDFFDALRAGKAETLDDIAKAGLGGFGTILYSLVNVESQTKVVLGKLIKQIITHARKLRPNDILTTRTGIAGLTMLGLGFVFLTLPGASYHIIGYTAAVGTILWLVWKILQVSGRDMPPSERQARVLLLLPPLLLVMFIACHPSYIPFVENIIVGILFLWLGEKFFRRSLLIRENSPGKIILILISVLFALLAVFSVAAPSKIYSGKSLTIGSFLMLMGIALIFSEIHRIVTTGKKEEENQ